MTDVRDCKRVMIDDCESAEFLLKKLYKYLPATCEGGIISGLNERFRFLKYGPGNKFEAHYDGVYERNKHEKSLITIQFYLNDVKKGGATRFYDDDFPEVFKNTLWFLLNFKGFYDCEAKIGKMSFFRIRLKK